MAVTKNVLNKGSVNLVLHIFLEQDGALGGELVDHVIVDPAELGLPKYPALQLTEAWHSLSGFDVTLKSGGLVPRPIWTFSRESSDHIDFSRFGGLADRGDPPPSDDDGKVLISTKGFDQIGAQGALVLLFRR